VLVLVLVLLLLRLLVLSGMQLHIQSVFLLKHSREAPSLRAELEFICSSPYCRHLHPSVAILIDLAFSSPA
jgi:hypothetical protein